MKNSLKKILSLIMLLSITFSFSIVYASVEDNDFKVEEVEYSEEYKQWLELSDEEKERTIEPRKYEIKDSISNDQYLKSINNVFKVQQLLRAAIPTSYTLQDIIPENLKVGNQMQTNTCWAFSTLGALESTLGLKNYKASLPVKEYDFSERHMSYGVTRDAFLNNQINPYGYTRKISDGGNFNMAMNYLSNGMGAVNENVLPFEDNEDDIDISLIQNSDVQTTIYDTKEFPTVFANEREQIMQKMKEHIMNYGGLYANVYGPELNGDNSYNNKTGAVYSTNGDVSAINHAIVIVGWDDNYSKENFNEEQRPENNGAWIVKNSWGEESEQSLSEFKQQIFNANPEMGWSSPEQIDNSIVQYVLDENFGEGRTRIEGDTVYIEVGIDGFMYYSYEDATIYTGVSGFERATDSKDYDTVYQNDLLGSTGNIRLTTPGTVSLANVFTRNSNSQEILDKISIYSTQGYEYKVLVNPNNDSKAAEDLIEVDLKEGNTQTVSAGYHVLEFVNPIKLNGNKFVVVIQILNAGDEKYIALEKQQSGTKWEMAEVNSGESFIAIQGGLESNNWQDTATWQNETVQGNLCIKAYATNQEDVELSEIYVNKEPNKTEYQEGENFDSTGMEIFAKYNDGSIRKITQYQVVDGDNLSAGKTSITIRYEENGITKETTQKIIVNESEEKITLSSIYISKEPTKTEYNEGENFDKTGMVVIARYSNRTEKEITNYEIVNGNNLSAGTTNIIISYEEGGVIKETTQEISVNETQAELTQIYIKESPKKVVYNEGESFEPAGMVVIAKYSNGIEKEIANYEVIDGNNLQIGTTGVIIRYQENGIMKETMQNITVKEEQEEIVILEEIYIKTEPNKTNYKPEENFDETGMVVIAKYSDGSEKEITNYEIIGGENLQEGTTSVTIRYTENGVIRNATQEILVSEEEPVDPDNPSREPIPANFNNAEAKITESKLYFNSSNLNEATGEITIKVTGIIVEDDKYTEHNIKYYISGSQEELDDENNNERTATLVKESDGTYSMTVNISSDDIDNYDEIIESDTLFLHISETASLKEEPDKVVTVSNRVEVENASEPQCYIDGNYVGGIDDVLNYNNNNNNNNNNNKGDDTTAGGFLPYAGRTILIVISILIVAVSGVVAYHRYKYIDR